MKSKEPHSLSWGLFSKYRNELYGVAIILIMLFHAILAFPKLDQDILITHIGKYGSFAVDGFLIMSGISLFFSLKQREKRYSNRLRLIGEFYKKRFSRLILITLLFCIPALITKFLLDSHFSSDTVLAEINPIHPQNNYWYIWFIAFAYLLYPFIYFLLKKKAGLKQLITITIVYTLLFITLTMIFKDLALYNRFFGRIPSFLLGCILGKYVYEDRPCNKKIVLILFLSFILFGPIAYCLQHIPSIGANRLSALYRPAGAVLSLSVGFILISFFEYLQPKALKNILSTIGKYTLELYITHVAILFIYPFLFTVPSRFRIIIPFLIGAYILSAILSVMLQLLINSLLSIRARKQKLKD